MNRDKNMVALYVDKDTVNIYKASLDLYEACKEAIDWLVEEYPSCEPLRKLSLALAKADGEGY